MLRSIDGGASFSPLPLTTGRITGLAVDLLVPTTVYATGACIAHRGGPGCQGIGGVYRSLNAGTTWQMLSLPDALAIAIDPTTSGRRGWRDAD